VSVSTWGALVLLVGAIAAGACSTVATNTRADADAGPDDVVGDADAAVVDDVPADDGRPCRAGQVRCADDGAGVERCPDDGRAWVGVGTCDPMRGQACRGGACVTPCEEPEARTSSVGCEYYGVDLDNVVEMDGRDAAGQQFAIVVSNPDPRMTARVEVFRNDAPPGATPSVVMVASAVVGPMGLEVFRLPRRDVDCSTPGTNDGTGTCLSSAAYRVTSTFPVVAYQFNPLENAGVFSNDASLLLPTSALHGRYRVLGWPQQYARTGDRETNASEDLRSFVTIVGTRPGTRVTITPTTDVIPGGPLSVPQRAGAPFTVTLGAFDVLNLETGGFLADLTGTDVSATAPVHVFSGSECADVPTWRRLSDRLPACDHLEEQLFPLEAAGEHYVASRTPPRTSAVFAAGGRQVRPINEPEWFRVLNAADAPVEVTTTLPENLDNPGGPTVHFALAVGQSRDIRALSDFQIDATGPVSVGQFVGSQATTTVPNGLPGGDPSMIFIPAVGQWRQEHVFLTPDRYAFDFVQVVARPSARVTLDGENVTALAACLRGRSDGCIPSASHVCGVPAWVTYRCQLSFPELDPSQNPATVRPGRQNDGVHVVRTTDPSGLMVLVTGFDRYVSYGYPGGVGLTPR